MNYPAVLIFITIEHLNYDPEYGNLISEQVFLTHNKVIINENQNQLKKNQLNRKYKYAVLYNNMANKQRTNSITNHYISFVVGNTLQRCYKESC